MPLDEGPGGPRTKWLTWPQPDNLGCASCTVAPSFSATGQQTTKVWVTLTSTYATYTVTNVSVMLWLDDGSTAGLPVPYIFGAQTLSATRVKSLELVPSPTLPIKRGTITLAFSNGSTSVVTTDELIIGTATP